MPASKSKPHGPAEAVQVSQGSKHIVGINNLRVLITEHDGSWIAQGLEIDYFAEGNALESAKQTFEKGLTATIKEHIKVYGDINKLLVVAPSEVWSEFFKLKQCHVHSQISGHEVPCPSSSIDTSDESYSASLARLPFSGISYYDTPANR